MSTADAERHYETYADATTPMTWTDEELSRFDPFFDMITRLVVLKPTFWLTLAAPDKCIAMFYESKKIQRACLCPLRDIINKGRAPTIAALAVLPIVIIHDDEDEDKDKKIAGESPIEALIKRSGQAELARGHRAQCTAEGREFMFLFVASPTGAEWRSISFGLDRDDATRYTRQGPAPPHPISLTRRATGSCINRANIDLSHEIH